MPDRAGDELAFSVTFWVDDDDRSAGIENVAVWIENGNCYAQVVDNEGNLIECGHNRPDDVHRRWKALRDEMEKVAEERRAGREAAG